MRSPASFSAFYFASGYSGSLRFSCRFRCSVGSQPGDRSAFVPLKTANGPLMLKTLDRAHPALTRHFAEQRHDAAPH